MQPFNYRQISSLKEASSLVEPHSSFIAGGTCLVDLMKLEVATPKELIDLGKINESTLKEIATTNSGIVIGSLVSNSDCAHSQLIEKEFPLISQSILSGASAQLRNMATIGGNLMQKTRCNYFRDTASPCNKREQGTGCPAIKGFNRGHAILGTSDACISVHPSDLCVALAALDATINIAGSQGKRSIKINDFYLLPGNAPHKETQLKPGEIIESISLEKNNFQKNSYYLKVRDRASYAFALVSVACGLELSGKNIKQARLALGGVAPKPWRANEAEAYLQGQELNEKTMAKAAEIALADAKPSKHNGFKVALAKRSIVRALEQAGGFR